jgi:hypothetical protein
VAQDWLPAAPALSRADVWRQIAVDAYGKEVESAATYSYTWLADQVGHMGLGILLAFATILLAGLLPLPFDNHLVSGAFVRELAGFLVAVGLVCYWELSTYRSSVKEAAGGQFPLQKPLLQANAMVAALYMSIGAAMGWCLHLDWWLSVPLILLLIGAALLIALPWVRQKMIWQKAALPYLNRMANMPPLHARRRRRRAVGHRGSGAAGRAFGHAAARGGRRPGRLRADAAGEQHRHRACLQEPQRALHALRRAGRLRGPRAISAGASRDRATSTTGRGASRRC